MSRPDFALQEVSGEAILSTYFISFSFYFIEIVTRCEHQQAFRIAKAIPSNTL
jgi:hypothetical protein